MGNIDGTVEGSERRSGRGIFYRAQSEKRWRRQLAADAQGHFHWENAAPGEYRVFALEGEDSSILWENGDLRKALEGRSGKVSVEEGGTATVSLTVISREMLERVKQENE